MGMFEYKTLCDQDCPVTSQCPYDPAKNCELEEEFMNIAKKWASTLPDSPVTKLRIEALLYPLFRQYLWIQLAQEVSGTPIKDLRYVISALDLVLNSIRSTERLNRQLKEKQ